MAWTKQPFIVDHFTCYAGRAKAQAERQWHESNKTSPDGWADGVHHYVTPHNDDD